MNPFQKPQIENPHKDMRWYEMRFQEISSEEEESSSSDEISSSSEEESSSKTLSSEESWIVALLSYQIALPSYK